MEPSHASMHQQTRPRWCKPYVSGSLSSASFANASHPQAPRTSGLQAPVMELTGHSGEIFAAKFDPTGTFIASGSMDRSTSTYVARLGLMRWTDAIK